jgi:FkbM family methyltransferase
MKNKKIDNNLIYYYESDDPVVKILEDRGVLFGESNFKTLDEYTFDKNGLIVDCGAHIGTFCFSAGHNGRKILAIEGAAKNAECLEKTFCDLKNVSVKHSILLDEIKKCDFTTDLGPFGHAEENKDGKSESNTLDNILSKENIINVSAIKYDLEGNESKAINGSKKTIEKYKPTLLVEVNGHCLRLNGEKPIDLFNKIEEIGYEYFLPLANGFLLSINKDSQYPFCVSDIICIHKDILNGNNNFKIKPPLNKDEIYDIFWKNYNISNEDCKKYFDSINV